MTDAEIRSLLMEHWEEHANEADFEAAYSIYHDDAVLEWPQSVSGVVEKNTFRAMRQYAPRLEFKTWRIVRSGNYWTAENLMKLEDQDPQFTVSILEFREDKVAREIVYITEPFEAAPERSKWAERFEPHQAR